MSRAIRLAPEGRRVTPARFDATTSVPNRSIAMRRRPFLSIDSVQSLIVLLRGHKVILDGDLAKMYKVEVRALVQAVKRNMERFPADFMFQLTLAEVQRLSRSQVVILKPQFPENIEPSSSADRRGSNRKYLPHAFTEQGIAMLSSVLRSPRAVQVNIEIMRAFVRLRQLLSSHEALAKKVDELEQKYDEQFRVVFDAIRELIREPPIESRPIGFNRE